MQVSELLEERGKLRAELAALQHQQARVPLLARSSSEVASVGGQSGQDNVQVAQLQDKVCALSMIRFVGA